MLLFDHACLQPVFEGFVALLLPNLLLESLLLFDSQLLLLLQSFGNQFAFLPFEHLVSSLLILLVEGSLLEHHLLVEVLLCLKHEDFPQTFLMLLDPEPLLVVDLGFGNFSLLLGVHVEDGLVHGAHLRLVFLSKVNLRLGVGIDVGLGCLVETFEQLFVDYILALLFIEVHFVFVVFVAFAFSLFSVFGGALVSQIGVVLVSLLQLFLLFEVDDLGVVDTDGASESLGAHHFVDQVHRLGRQLNPLDSLLQRQRLVDVADSVRIFVVKGSCRHHLHGLTIVQVSVECRLCAHCDRLILLKAGASHRPLCLLLLQLFHDLLFLDCAEVVLVGHARSWIDAGFSGAG